MGLLIQNIARTRVPGNPIWPLSTILAGLARLLRLGPQARTAERVVRLRGDCRVVAVRPPGDCRVGTG